MINIDCTQSENILILLKIIVLFMFIQYFHTFSWIFSTFYGFVFSKNWFDYYYMLMNLITALSWTLFKNECIISLIRKWYDDPTYKMGTNTEPTDILYFFGEKHYNLMKIIHKIFLFVKSASMYIVLKRMHYPYDLEVSLLYLFYSLVTLNSNLYRGIFFFLFIFIIFNLKRTPLY